MLRKVLVGVALVVGFLVAFIATRPSHFVIERSATLPAPPAVVFARLADFGKWSAWSPWERMDPAMKRTFSGEPASVGHAYGWVGNDEVGEGRMTIVSLTPPARVEIRLEFLKPMKATNATVFTVEPEGTGSRVTWAMSGTQGFVMKAIGLVMNMDKVVGKDFEQGLSNLADVLKADASHAAR
jgi:uncharacterized protein YndB with AHSA1/START domain